jgi:ribosomal protein S18 acetylase RimI-like enzyme
MAIVMPDVKGATVNEVHLRRAAASDSDFLAAMLAEAVDWRPDMTTRPVADLMGMPELWHYVDAWPKQSDFGLVAEVEQPVGAAWWRYFTVDHQGYGFIDETVPEVSIGVAHGYRSGGIGRSLLVGLIAEGRAVGLAGLCLSVEPENPVKRLYERLGFEAVGGVGGSVTMLLRLSTDPD